MLCVSNVATDPREVVAVNHTLEADKYSAAYTLTVYVSLLKRDPLLLASIESFQFILLRLLETGQPVVHDSNTTTTTENKVHYPSNL